MKTAISLPDDLSAAIDACARELKLTRSGVLAQAAREFVARRRRAPIRPRHGTGRSTEVVNPVTIARQERFDAERRRSYGRRGGAGGDPPRQRPRSLVLRDGP